MASQLKTEAINRVAEWIESEAHRLNISVKVYPESIVLEGNWIRVPVGVNQEGDAYERATWLQQIEDAWDPHSLDGHQLLLIPAKREESSKADLYAQATDLMTRQDLLLAHMSEAGADAEIVQRFYAVRQEWENVLSDMGQRSSSLRNEVP